LYVVPLKIKFEMSSSDTSMSISDDEFVLDILYYLPRPRLFRDRSNPLEEFDDIDFKCRFRQVILKKY